MARKRKVVEANYPEIIESLKKEIDAATQVIEKNKTILSEKKKELKKAERDYESYKIAKAKADHEKEVNDLLQKLIDSGMSVSDIEKNLFPEKPKESTKVKTEK